MLSTVASIRVEFERLGKRFSGRTIFSGITGALKPASILVVVGPNGSGKSTLLNILAGLVRPSRGTVRYVDAGGSELPRTEWFSHTGVAAPDMNLYDELTGTENLAFFARLRGRDAFLDTSEGLAEHLGLKEDDRKRPVAAYSSGMKQRLRLVYALLHRPAVVLLDEPGSNLDSFGHQRLTEIVADLRATASVAVATNDPREMAWGDELIQLAG